MDYFFTLLKKSLVLTVFIVFGFVATYIPQPYNQINTAEAGGLTGGATEPTQLLNNVQLGLDVAQNTLSAAYNAITSFATNSNWLKESVWDGIAWAVAKSIVSSMVQSLISWINSGFEGSPAFVTDLGGFLINAADEAVGNYIADIGALGSFICSPFRLDVQISLALEYDRIRGDGQPAPTCTLSGIIDNIEGFITGDFIQGGWNDWFDVTATPQTYTPYGSVLSAQQGMHARIINAKGEELTLLNYGDGFLSGEICEMVHGAASPREECFISKPGKIIEEALSFNLDTGRQTLIAADEFNEIVSALLGQLAKEAITGAAGLLGLSGGTGHTYSGFSGGSYVNQLASDGADSIDPDKIKSMLVESRAVQVDIADLARDYQPAVRFYADDLSNRKDRRDQAESAYKETVYIIDNTENTEYGIIPALDSLIFRFDSAVTANNYSEQSLVLSDFAALGAYTETDISNYRSKWEIAIR